MTKPIHRSAFVNPFDESVNSHVNFNLNPNGTTAFVVGNETCCKITQRILQKVRPFNYFLKDWPGRVLNLGSFGSPLFSITSRTLDYSATALPNHLTFRRLDLFLPYST